MGLLVLHRLWGDVSQASLATSSLNIKRATKSKIKISMGLSIKVFKPSLTPTI